MLYELRIYHCQPGRLPDLMKRFDTITLKLWDRHGIKQADRKSTRLNSSHGKLSRMPSSA